MRNAAILLMVISISVMMVAAKENEKTADQKLRDKLFLLQATLKKLRVMFNNAKLLIHGIEEQKNNLPELSKEDMFYLERLMEQKFQVEQMISNIIKAAAQTQTVIIANTKA